MPNALREKLSRGEVALGLWMGYPAPGIIECIGADWDWVWIDGQHGQIDYQTMLGCVRAADVHGLAPIPRVAGHDYGAIGPVMDMRTAGVMVPMVDTREQAVDVVRAARFPPTGARSYGGRRVVDLGGRDYVYNANEDTLLVVQIETPEAMENVEAIAGVEGVDVLLFAPIDMKLRMGIPLETRFAESEKLARALERTAKAAENAGKFSGTLLMDGESLRIAVSLGYRLIAGAGDNELLRKASAARREELKNSLKEPG